MSKKLNILESPLIREMCQVTANMYRQGWDERNGGNISVLLKKEELEKYLKVNKVIRTIPLTFEVDPIVYDKYFLVTGTGKYFKNVMFDPAYNLGIVHLTKDGKNAEVLWGWTDGGKFTSEFPAHIMCHATRLKQDPEHRIVMHTHPTYTIAMTSCFEVNEKKLTKALWQSNTEAIVVFPDGVGVLPCMVCGTNEIGIATAKKMENYRLVVWTNHGIYGTGKNIDEAFGLIETVEKTAQIYMLTLGHVKNVIPESVLWGLVDLWSLKPLEGVLTERKNEVKKPAKKVTKKPIAKKKTAKK